MEPQIRYARTDDGVSIAVWMSGEGIPAVQAPPLPFGQVELASRFAEDIQWSRPLALHTRLVRYDGRGSGLSDRTATDYSLDAHLRDLDAVVSLVGPGPVVLWSQITSGPVVIAYAAAHPERVSHLVLWSSWARSADVMEESAGRGLMALAEADWEMFTETAAQALSAWSAGELAHRVAAFLRESVTRETGLAILAALLQFDATALLPQVSAPTLVLHPRRTPLPDLRVSRGLAAAIPNARLVVLEEGAAMSPFAEADLRTIGEFLGLPYGPADRSSGRIMAVLFTDLVSHTSMMQRLGDAKGRDVLREHERITREVIAQHDGQEIKTMGDGFIATFGSVTRGMECAVSLQRAFATHNRSADEPLAVRVGLNAGEPIEEDGDLFGSTVILASRIAAQAEAGEILVPDTVRHLLAGKDFTFVDHGDFLPKGFDDAVRLFEVRWQE